MSGGLYWPRDDEAGKYRHIRLISHGKRRVVGVRCSRCEQERKVPFCPYDRVVAVLWERGWSNPGDHLRCICPVCAEDIRRDRKNARAVKPVPSKTEEVTEMVKPTTPIVMPVKADPPRTPTPADRRRISEALHDLYDVTKQCYDLNNDDDYVAKTLDVPRAWVAEVREFSFGPNRSAAKLGAVSEIGEVVKRAEAAVVAATEAAIKAESAVAEMNALRLRLEGMV